MTRAIALQRPCLGRKSIERDVLVEERLRRHRPGFAGAVVFPISSDVHLLVVTINHNNGDQTMTAMLETLDLD